MVNLNREPTADELAGVEWSNSISEPRRADWLQLPSRQDWATPGQNTSGPPSSRGTKKPQKVEISRGGPDAFPITPLRCRVLNL